MRIVHCADVHIGMEFVTNKAKSRQRKAEILQGFLRVVEFGKKEGADAFLIAGDLFNGDKIDKDTVISIRDAFAAIPQTDVYIAPGNHDALTASSPYRQVEWSPNVTIFQSEPQIIERPDKGYRIWGRGFESPYVEDRLLAGVSMPQDELINIGILHGQTVGKGGNSIYNPITDADIEGSGFDYLALGHVHKQTDIMQLGKTFYAYPGTIEGQGFDEDGIKGFYTGDISKMLLYRNELIMEYVSLSKRRHYHIDVDVTGVEDRYEVADRIQSAMEQADGDSLYRTDSQDNLYKVNLTGTVKKERTIDLDALTAKVSELAYYVEIKDSTRFEPDYEELAKEHSLKGAYAARMLDKIKECENNGDTEKAGLYRDALEIGIRAFCGEVRVDED